MLQISTFNDSLQGQNNPGLSWVTFTGDPDAPIEPKSVSSKHYTFTDVDKSKVNNKIPDVDRFETRLELKLCFPIAHSSIHTA